MSWPEARRPQRSGLSAQRRRWLKSALGAGAVVGLSLGLAGCGFQLRRAPAVPFRRMALAGFAARSPMEAALRRALVGQVEIVASAAQAEAVLVAVSETREKSVLASTPGALVREIQLRLRFRFRVDRPDGRPGLPATDIAVSRDMSYNETQALAKAHEEAQIYLDMEADAARQALQRLAALKP